MKKIIFVIALGLLFGGCCETQYVYIEGKRPLLPELIEDNNQSFTLDYEVIKG